VGLAMGVWVEFVRTSSLAPIVSSSSNGPRGHFSGHGASLSAAGYGTQNGGDPKIQARRSVLVTRGGLRELQDDEGQPRGGIKKTLSRARKTTQWLRSREKKNKRPREGVKGSSRSMKRSKRTDTLEGEKWGGRVDRPPEPNFEWGTTAPVGGGSIRWHIGVST